MATQEPPHSRHASDEPEAVEPGKKPSDTLPGLPAPTKRVSDKTGMVGGKRAQKSCCLDTPRSPRTRKVPRVLTDGRQHFFALFYKIKGMKQAVNEGDDLYNYKNG